MNIYLSKPVLCPACMGQIFVLSRDEGLIIVQEIQTAVYHCVTNDLIKLGGGNCFTLHAPLCPKR
jgi:hypothetical protein